MTTKIATRQHKPTIPSGITWSDSVRCTDVWATRRLGDRHLGNKFFWEDHLGNTGWTFGRQQLDVWTTGVETFGRQKLSVTPRTAAEARVCKWLSVFSCFRTHLSKVHRRSNTDWQRLKRLWSRLARRKPLPEQIFISGPNVQLLSPKRPTRVAQMIV